LLKIHLNIMLPSTPGTPKWKNITGRWNFVVTIYGVSVEIRNGASGI
jgi:hypothetical protein